MSNAWETTTEDVLNVIHKMGRKATSDQVETIFDSLDHFKIEDAVIRANDLETQRTYAYAEIERQINCLDRAYKEIHENGMDIQSDITEVSFKVETDSICDYCKHGPDDCAPTKPKNTEYPNCFRGRELWGINKSIKPYLNKNVAETFTKPLDRLTDEQLRARVALCLWKDGLDDEASLGEIVSGKNPLYDTREKCLKVLRDVFGMS